MISFVKIFVKSRHIAISFPRHAHTLSSEHIWRVREFFFCLFIVKFVFPGNRENLTTQTCSRNHSPKSERAFEHSSKTNFHHELSTSSFVVFTFFSSLLIFRRLAVFFLYFHFSHLSDEVESFQSYFISGSVIGNIPGWWWRVAWRVLK